MGNARLVLHFLPQSRRDLRQLARILSLANRSPSCSQWNLHSIPAAYVAFYFPHTKSPLLTLLISRLHLHCNLQTEPNRYTNTQSTVLQLPQRPEHLPHRHAILLR